MIKKIYPVTVAFDCEWIPDADTIKRVYGLSNVEPDSTAIEMAWSKAGASVDNPQPFLKVALCRIVSICAVVRKDVGNEIDLKILTFPSLNEITTWSEAKILKSFLTGVGKNSAQLVGYNCIGSDIPAMVQRAVAHGLSIPEFAKRPEKPWGGADYFSSFSDHVFDIGKVVSFGRAMPSLHELASACGIPGKIDASGDQVFNLWLDGQYEKIIQYNVFDAITTYLLWLRCALFSGELTAMQHKEEELRVKSLIAQQISLGHTYLTKYLSALNIIDA